MSAFLSSALNRVVSSTQGTAGHFQLIMTGNSSHTHLDNATLALFTDVNTSITISVIYILVTAINLIGNTLSLWILLFRTSPKTVSIIFMIHLTLTDLALGVALPFQIAYQLQRYHWTLGRRMCRYFYFYRTILLKIRLKIGKLIVNNVIIFFTHGARILMFVKNITNTNMQLSCYRWV